MFFVICVRFEDYANLGVGNDDVKNEFSVLNTVDNLYGSVLISSKWTSDL